VSGVKDIWAGSSATSRCAGSDNVKPHLNVIHTRHSPSLSYSSHCLPVSVKQAALPSTLPHQCHKWFSVVHAS